MACGLSVRFVKTRALSLLRLRSRDPRIVKGSHELWYPPPQDQGYYKGGPQVRGHQGRPDGGRPGPVVDLAREILGSWGYLKEWPALLDKRKCG